MRGPRRTGAQGEVRQEMRVLAERARIQTVEFEESRRRVDAERDASVHARPEVERTGLDGADSLRENDLKIQSEVKQLHILKGELESAASEAKAAAKERERKQT